MCSKKLNLVARITQIKPVWKLLCEQYYANDGTKLWLKEGTKSTYYIGSLEYTQSSGEAYVSRIPFSGGYIEAVKTSSAIQYLPRYWFTDHLGSVRSIVSQTGAVIEANDFTPFGKRWEVASRPKSSNRYLFNGKPELTCGYLDYGARLYDPEIGRWIQPDPLADVDPGNDPYVYCLNNPVNAIDPDGKLVIFINGMHPGDQGGTSEYWGDFNIAVMVHLRDFKAIYRDGSFGGAVMALASYIPQNRKNMGYFQGVADAPMIVSRISDQNGNIVEKIRIITHSMGAAYAKGYVQALVDYFRANGIDLSTIDFEADFAPFQPTDQRAVDGVTTFQFAHSGDAIAGNDPMLGAIYMNTSFDAEQIHKIISFWKQAFTLPVGEYKVIDGKIIPVKK